MEELAALKQKYQEAITHEIRVSKEREEKIRNYYKAELEKLEARSINSLGSDPSNNHAPTNPPNSKSWGH
jgi:hypothetical protein